METVPAKQFIKSTHEYNFGTRGLTLSDFEFIGRCLNRYGVVASYAADNNSFDTLEGFLQFVTSNECSSIHWMGRTSQGNLFVSLVVVGAISNWSVEKPQEELPIEWAISQQLFNDVRDKLRQRREFIAGPPWHIARNSIVWLPLLFLLVKVIFQPSYLTDLRTLQLTTAVALMHYGFAWADRRRWYRTAIARPRSTLSRIMDRWPEVAIAVISTALSGVLEEILKIITK